MKWLLVLIAVFLLAWLVSGYIVFAAAITIVVPIIFGEPIDTLLYPERHKGDEWSSRA